MLLTCFKCQTPLFLISNQCKSCPDVITNCTTCLSTTYCSACLDHYTYLHYVNNDTQLCFKCEISLQYCLTCSNRTQCTGCVNNSYFLNQNGTCQTCESVITGCVECVSIWLGPNRKARCTLCSSSLYFINANYEC
jgi:hypothetical protein